MKMIIKEGSNLKTEIIKLNADKIDIEKLRYAAEVIKNGGLVAFPTETVYGLGANALSEDAVNKIFIAKGRPNDNPLIVHISDIITLKDIVLDIPPIATKLIDKFWPGPLTLIMKKSPLISSVVTAGLDTVAVRMPAHPVALALITEAGVPIAAPSANISGKPSPTIAKHVIEDLCGKVDVIIDAGSAKVGLESTVLDITVYPPTILRPGGITANQINGVLGEGFVKSATTMNEDCSKPRSPGTKYIHYSPKADMIIVKGEVEKVVGKINALIDEKLPEVIKIGVLATNQTRDSYHQSTVLSLGDRDDFETIAANLFSSLREFDERGIQLILAEAVEESEMGVAIMNRMNKAAGFKIIQV